MRTIPTAAALASGRSAIPTAASAPVSATRLTTPRPPTGGVRPSAGTRAGGRSRRSTRRGRARARRARSPRGARPSASREPGPGPRLSAREVNLVRAALDIRDIEDEAVDRREAPLPERVLEHDGDHVPAVLEGAYPGLDRGRREEVGEHEEERSRGHRARVREQELEPVLDRRRGRPERRAVLLTVEVFPQRLGLRRQPEGLAVAVAEVEIAEKAVRLDRARPDQLDDRALRLALPQPREPSREELHLGAPVGDHDDARRLVRVVLAQHEGVGVARRRQPRGRAPVDRPQRVSGDIRPRPRDVGAGSARALRIAPNASPTMRPRGTRGNDASGRARPRPAGCLGAPARAQGEGTRRGTLRAPRPSRSGEPGRGRRAGTRPGAR